jgi:predicted SprT family Zn-dependent metalloprotease
VKTYIDPTERFRIAYPSDWHVAASSDEVAEYFWVRPTGAQTIGFLLVVSPATLGLTARQILAERQQHYKLRVDHPLENIADCIFTTEAGLTLHGFRYIFADPAGQSIVEEHCLVRRDRIMLLRSQWIVGKSSAYQLQRLQKARESFVLGPFSPQEQFSFAEDDVDRTLYSPRLWTLLRRVVEAHCDPHTRIVRVAYEVQIRNDAHTAHERARLAVLERPLAEVLSGSVNGVPISRGDSRTSVDLDVDFGRAIAPGETVTLGVRYQLCFTHINRYMRTSRRLFFDSHCLICSTMHWLPRLYTTAARPERYSDAKCPFQLVVDVPHGYWALASGQLIQQESANGRTRFVFTNQATNIPHVCFVASSTAVYEGASGGINVLMSSFCVDTLRIEASTAELSRTIGEGYGCLVSWLGEPAIGDKIAAVFYGGDICLGLGPLLLLGRGFETAMGSMDRELCGQTTLRETVLHELAHLWFGGISTAHGPRWSRWHEMLAGFLSVRLLEQLAPRTHFKQALQRALQLYQVMSEHPEAQRDGYHGNWHAKWGMVTLSGLQACIGKEAINAALARLFQQHFGQCFTADDLTHAIVATTAGGAAEALARWLPSDHSLPRPPSHWHALLA